MAMRQYAEHDVIRHYVSVVVMVTNRWALLAVADWCTGVVTWTTWRQTLLLWTGDGDQRLQQHTHPRRVRKRVKRTMVAALCSG